MKTGERLHECPVETSLELLSGKWKPRILWKLHKRGVLRFAEIKRGLDEITPKMLTQQLRELEQDGLVTRTVYAQVPPKVEYALSDLGQTLGPILEQLAVWGTSHQRQIREILTGQEEKLGCSGAINHAYIDISGQTQSSDERVVARPVSAQAPIHLFHQRIH